ncbi:PDIA3 isomerase, partial [Amia calva]|nr:PDIA3 isomerase [Amia calva]
PPLQVDCTVNSETCSRFGVNGYPTLKIFHRGEESSVYDGPRTAEGIVSYMKKQAGPSSVELRTKEDLEAFVNNFDASVVGFFVDGDSAGLAEFLKAASAMRDGYRFAHTTAPSLREAHAVTAEEVLLFRPPRLRSKFEEAVLRHAEPITPGTLRKFIRDNIFGLCPHLTNENREQLMGRDLLMAIYDIDYLRNPKGSNYWRNRVMKVASQFSGRGLSFVVADRAELGEELEEFGLGVAEAGGVPLVALRTAAGHKYSMKEEFTADGRALERFLLDYFSGRLKRYLKSEAPPEHNDGPVKVVVAETFDDIVNDASRDVLVEFYAPWCGHCKSLEPKYTELAQQLAADPHILITKMDATTNDIPPGYDVQGFPTIYFAPMGQKDSPRRYEGGREVSDFLSYLKREATHTPVLSSTKQDL